MKTVTMIIGNSDNKLTQNEWSHFAIAFKQSVGDVVHRIHFHGGSDFDAPWQNCCIVAEIADVDIPTLRATLRGLRRSFKQDSIALVEGDTQLIA